MKLLLDIIGWVSFTISIIFLIIWILVLFYRSLRWAKKAKNDLINDNIESASHIEVVTRLNPKILVINFLEFCQISSLNEASLLLLSFSAAFLVLSMVDYGNIYSKIPLILQASSTIFLLFVVLIMPIIAINYLVKNYKQKSYSFIYIVSLLILIGVFVYTLMHVFIQNQLKNSNKAPDYFFVIIIFTFIMLINIVYSMINILSVSIPKSLKILVGVISICFMSMFLYFSIGTYNISKDEWDIIKHSSALLIFFKVSFYGIKGLSELPSSIDNKTLVFYIEFLIGKFYDIILISLFIAFFYDALKNED